MFHSVCDIWMSLDGQTWIEGTEMGKRPLKRLSITDDPMDEDAMIEQTKSQTTIILVGLDKKSEDFGRRVELLYLLKKTSGIWKTRYVERSASGVCRSGFHRLENLQKKKKNLLVKLQVISQIISWTFILFKTTTRKSKLLYWTFPSFPPDFENPCWY